MALIKCKECGHEVSSTAATCPNCGAKASKPMGCGSLVGILFLIAVIAAVIGGNEPSPSTSNSSSISSDPSSSSAASSTPVTPEPGSQWFYHQADDEMGKGTRYHALVTSSNTVDFSFPYNGPQNAKLEFRTHPRYGKHVIFRIEKGQLLCDSFDGCTVLVRFDEAQGQQFSATGAADNSTETLFITNYSRFVEKMLKAKRVRIAVNVYQEGVPVFDFDVSGFDVAKYKPST